MEGQLHSASVGLETISCLTGRPSSVAATRAVNLLIVFRIQLSAWLMSHEGTRTAPWMSAGVMTRALTCEHKLTGGVL